MGRISSKTFKIKKTIGDGVLESEISFSPAPDPGLNTKVARFLAERITEALTPSLFAQKKRPLNHEQTARLEVRRFRF